MDAGKEDATIDMVKLPMNEVLLTLVEERWLRPINSMAVGQTPTKLVVCIWMVKRSKGKLVNWCIVYRSASPIRAYYSILWPIGISPLLIGPGLKIVGMLLPYKL